jgi:hypothetical protein
MTLAAYVLGFLLNAAPLSVHAFTGVDEATTRARYESIAADIATASTEAPLYAGTDGTAETAITLAVWAVAESGKLAADVDACERGGDRSSSWSLWQLREPWTPKDVSCGSRLNAARRALDVMASSRRACREAPQDERFAVYARGTCDSEQGRAISRRRSLWAKAWLREHPWGQS